MRLYPGFVEAIKPPAPPAFRLRVEIVLENVEEGYYLRGTGGLRVQTAASLQSADFQDLATIAQRFIDLTHTIEKEQQDPAHSTHQEPPDTPDAQTGGVVAK